MSDAEFTISRILRDPLIRQMLKADHIQLSDFAQLLREIAFRLGNDPKPSTAISRPRLSSCREGDRSAAREGASPAPF
ncbi:hypothetical protein ACO34A_26805 (plasmid) [Rhizobium sp. ACO-34A]|nr:hypothetical protein [Rhizobium sp. ACO-34A]ATN37380.1 hypothetical protein ACO34A_26805 [Rhizobium sp. ACO-34A]